jgi:hypothetical protein
MNTVTVKTDVALALGDAMRKAALSYAAKTGTAIDLVVVKSANAKHEFSLAPSRLMNAIRSTLSQEEIDALPRPNSRYNDAEVVASNEMADINLWKDPSKPDGKAKEQSFYVVWSDNTPEGVNVIKELDYCSRINAEGMKIDDIPSAWQKQHNATPQTLKKYRKYLEGRRGTIRKAYKDAVRLIVQLEMVNELDGCIAEIEDDENYVIVSNKLKPKAEWKEYSIGAFLKLDPLKASETDGSYAALEATAKREQGGSNGVKGTELKLNAVATPESSDKVATVWHSYLAELMADRKGDKYAAYIRHLTSDGGRQAVLTLRGIQRAINGIMQLDTIRSIADIEEEKIKNAA